MEELDEEGLRTSRSGGRCSLPPGGGVVELGGGETEGRCGTWKGTCVGQGSEVRMTVLRECGDVVVSENCTEVLECCGQKVKIILIIILIILKIN